MTNKTIEHIALSKLVPSPENVRRTNSQVGVGELADSIDAHGLIQNLTVRKGAKGKFEVVAGARRLAALRLLVKEGHFQNNTEIPCLFSTARATLKFRWLKTWCASGCTRLTRSRHSAS